MSFLTKLANRIFGKKGKKVEVVKHKDPTEFLKSVTVTALEQEVRPAKSGRIILYEDSETWANIMKTSLEKEGYNVHTYSNPVNALDHIRKYKPDLVLMDVNMPVMNGHEATKMIKSKMANRELPVVILTSANTSKDRMDAMKVGARSILTKDQPLEDILFAVNAYMTNTALKSDISRVIKIHKNVRKGFRKS